MALAGSIAGLVTLISSVSFAVLIFSGELTPYISWGIALLVATAVIAGSLISILSGCSPLVSMADDDTVPIMALLVSLVLAGIPEGTPSDERFLTAVAALSITAIITGIGLTALGAFRMGSLVRYMPYPVMGGYFAGAGLLLMQGSMGIVIDLRLTSMLDLGAMLEYDLLIRWLPMVLAAIVIRWISLRLTQPYAIPCTVVVLTILFYLVSWALGITNSQLASQGWMIGPFPEGSPSLWNPVLLDYADDIHWRAILSNISSVATIVMLSAVSLMLTASNISILQGETVDINRELKVAGVASFASGVAGGVVALPSMALTKMAMTVGAPKNRLVGLVVALVCGLTLLYGMPIIAWLPKSILAGLLMFIGWSFIERWLIDARSQLHPMEYVVVIIIVVVVATLGFLQGVFVGLMCAIVLFVVNYSRINVVRYALDGGQLKSNVERSETQQRYLHATGSSTYILKLQGYLFFGTAAALVSRVEERMKDTTLPDLKSVLFDFSQVSDMDSSAALSFMSLAQEAVKSNRTLLLTGLTEPMQERLLGRWFNTETDGYVRLFPDIDRGLEWCEEQLLSEETDEQASVGILQQLSTYIHNAEDREIFKQYLEYRVVKPGDILTTQGEPAEEMFLLDDCTASVFLDTGNNRTHRIRRAGAGTVFGEVGFYLDTTRTATVVIDEGGSVYVLTRDAYANMEEQHPYIATAMHKFMIEVIAHRLQRTTATMRAVLI